MRAFLSWLNHVIGSFLTGVLLLVALVGLPYEVTKGNTLVAYGLIVPVLIFMTLFSPFYTILSALPYWAVAGVWLVYNYGMQVTNPMWGDPTPVVWVFWVWSIYPLIRGIIHTITWEWELMNFYNPHPITKHPYLALGLELGVTAGMSYLASGHRKAINRLSKVEGALHPTDTV